MNDELILKIVLAFLVATSAMSLFSYMISVSFRELYKEWVLLSYCLTSLNISLSRGMKAFLGWLIHYSIGLLFVIGYHLSWENNTMEETWTSALILGAVSGILGILGWLIIFKITKYVPSIDFKGYYLQLFFAHVIFGLAAFAVYNSF